MRSAILGRLLHFNSIKKKLLVLMTCIGIFSVLAGATTSAWYSYKNAKASIENKMKVTTNIIGSMTGPDILFDDSGHAEEVLTALSKEEEVVLACLYRGENDKEELFASYRTSAKSVNAPQKCASSHPENEIGRLGELVSFPSPVIDAASNSKIGKLVLFAQMKSLDRMVAMQFLSTCIIVLVVSILALGGSYIITPIITDPIQSLVDLTKRISEEKDYSLRASTSSSDEVGVLSASFNHMLATIQDREKELYEINEKVEAASRSKSEFLANMSHEIRTPINGILGFAQLLSVMELDDKQRSFVEIILSSGNALLTIINDILDFSKIEAGKLHIESVPFDLQKVVEEVVDIMTARAEEKGLEIALRVAPGTPTYVIGDPSRVRQVLTNYVGNAIKFTEKGHVMVNAEARILGNTETIIRFEVIDTGIGIPKDAQKKIFEKFIQADSTTTKRYGGTGLGLAISQQLAHLMGGEVGLFSEEGKGSTFWFEVPFRLDQAQQQPTGHTAVDLTECRMLVVDDHEVNRRILLELSEGWGIYAEAAESGEEALHLLKRAHSEGRAFHLAILDYQLPNMDGEDLSNLIKTDQNLADTSLILLTSMGMRGDAAKFQEIGFEAYLVKPARANVLLDTISTVWLQRRQRQPQVDIVTQHTFNDGGDRRMRDGKEDERTLSGNIHLRTGESHPQQPHAQPQAAPVAPPAAPQPQAYAPPPQTQQPAATGSPLGPSLEDRMASIIEQDKQTSPTRGGIFHPQAPQSGAPVPPQPVRPLVSPTAAMTPAPAQPVAPPAPQPQAAPVAPVAPRPAYQPAPPPQSSPLAPVSAALHPQRPAAPTANHVPQQQPMAAPPQPAAPQPAAQAPAASATGQRVRQAGAERILLVEDQLTNRLVVENMLENIKLKTVHAENGEVAVDKVKREEFDLVLMDVQMPVMNGYDATRNIRKFEQETGRKPCFIIAVTANAMQGDREKCLQAGMNDYIAKPIQAPELERVVKKYLALAYGEQPPA